MLRITIKTILVLIGFISIVACSSKDDAPEEVFEIEGEFIHLIPDCENSNNLEINCTEFISFMDNQRISVLIGGGDIIYVTNYVIIDNTIHVEKTNGLISDVSFSIESETTLIRVENKDVWLKKE